jgi:threonine aldolase
MLGGGMRQAGIIAAAGVYALESMVERLAEDHENARIAGEGLARIAGVRLAPTPQTNLIYFAVDGWKAPDLVERLAEAGVLCFDEGGRIRWVTHFGIERDEVQEALARLRLVVEAGVAVPQAGA